MSDKPTAFPANQEESNAVGRAQSEALHQDNNPTGEWTVEVSERQDGVGYLRDGDRTLASGGAQMLETIKCAHNAALAAEQGAQRHMEACRALLKVSNDEVLYSAIEELQQQLAAEREEREQAENDFLTAGRNNEKLRKQLAAEQRKYELAKDECLQFSGVNQQLREQLAKTERMLDLAGAQNMGIDNLAKLDDLQQQLAAEQEKSRVLGSIVEGLRAKLPPEETNPLMKQMSDSLEQKWVRKAK